MNDYPAAGAGLHEAWRPRARTRSLHRARDHRSDRRETGQSGPFSRDPPPPLRPWGTVLR